MQEKGILLNRYIEQILKIFNVIDGMMIVDTDGVIQYFYTAYPNVSTLGVQVIGQKLLDVYPELTKKTSYIMRCLATGQAFVNYRQSFTDYKGNTMETITTTLPIYQKGELIGAADLVIYLDDRIKDRNITLDIDLDKILQISKGKMSYQLDDIITCDRRMLAIKNKILLNADSHSPVLVYGKTGTGKELVVNAIHRCSERKNGPFISQNCAAIPATLLESILFGTVKGSFTGARDCEGLFEMADGGTLFLDEINSMELAAQAKLLRVIEEKRVRRLGDKHSKKVDVRIIAAVNEEPLQCVKEKRLREDLYYRLCVIRYDIPELRERPEDIELLMEYFRKYYNVKLGKNILRYSDEVYRIYRLYNWPGNVRELKNSIESAFQANFGASIEAGNIPEYIKNAVNFIADKEARERNRDESEAEILRTASLAEMVENYEKTVIQKQYCLCGENISKTARKLKLSRQTLWYKMKKYGLL